MATTKKETKTKKRSPMPVNFTEDAFTALLEMTNGMGVSNTALINKSVLYFYKNHFLPNKKVLTGED